jgi:hypothetical protein
VLSVVIEHSLHWTYLELVGVEADLELGYKFIQGRSASRHYVNVIGVVKAACYARFEGGGLQPLLCQRARGSFPAQMLLQLASQVC